MGTPQAAYPASISVGGVSAAFAGDATSVLTANTKYQITNTAHRRLDPTVAPVVKVNGVATSSSNYSIDYLFGIITFTADQGAATITVDGNYLPVIAFAKAKEVTLSFTNDVQDSTVLGTDGWKTKIATLRDFTGELSGFEIPANQTVEASDLNAMFAAGSPLFLDIDKGSGAQIFRAWIKIPGIEHKLAPDALYESTVKFEGHAFEGTGSTSIVAWSYGT